MAIIHELISKIGDKSLRERIEKEVEKLTKQKKFGLVFEEHIPECTPLYDIPISIGSKVAKKSGYMKDIYLVKSVDGDDVLCEHKDSREEKTFHKDELVSIAEFGEAIYPYLKPVDSICNAPDSDLWHTLIEADNYHALQLLEYLYAGKVDCIYIDPPYNTGARDWKYNNDFVDSSDAYRHSKWLSMMEKRLCLAKKLLNPKDSVLIVTIDEKEYLHLGCLLEELFPEARMQMVSTCTNPAGVARNSEFARTDEYIYFVKFGQSAPSPLQLGNEWMGSIQNTTKDKVHWNSLLRTGTNQMRTDRPNLFYPIFVSIDGKRIRGAGEPIPLSADKEEVIAPEGCKAIWPIHTDGSEGRWRVGRDTFISYWENHYVRLGGFTERGMAISYMASGEQTKVLQGEYVIHGIREDNSYILDDSDYTPSYIPGTQWLIPLHDASRHGSGLLRKIFNDKRFSFPKSLYAVHDTIRFFVANKPNALIVDFFAGSGTTLHAVNLLNAEDGGKRRCIMVTNNEVSDEEARKLKKLGYHPGDDEWEKLGIARYVTWPRTTCSIKGENIKGEPLNGNYLGSDIPMSDGFKANATYFKLGFLDKTAVELGRQFRELLPILWMKAGAIGPCPTLKKGKDVPPMLILPENSFAILNDESQYLQFRMDMENHPNINTIFFVTDFEPAYQSMARDFEGVTTYHLYRDYLDNFRINISKL